MQDDENVVIDTPSDPVEETVETPEQTESEETIETPTDEEKAQLEAANKKLFERAKKAEAELKALKGTAPAKPVSPQQSVEETVLLAQGMSEELLSELKAVAQVRKTSLIKAQNDPIFVAVKEKFESEQKKKEASLPASRGASAVKPKKTFDTPGLSREDHKKMVMESING